MHALLWFLIFHAAQSQIIPSQFQLSTVPVALTANTSNSVVKISLQSERQCAFRCGDTGGVIASWNASSGICQLVVINDASQGLGPLGSHAPRLLSSDAGTRMWTARNLADVIRSRSYNENMYFGFACEGQSLYISCPQGSLIGVLVGFYGRLSDEYCFVGMQVRTFSCSATNAQSSIANLCNGRGDCTFTVWQFGGDPCGGTYKYATVAYRCY